MLKEKIQNLLKEQRKTLKELCLAIDMTDTGLRGIYSRNSCELSTLRKMAEFFDVPVSDLLEEEEVRVLIRDNEDSFNMNDSKTIEELTKIINEQRKRIDFLTDKLLK